MRSLLQEGCRLKPNARTLWEIEAKALHLPAETASALYADVLDRMRKALSIGEKRRATVHDAESLHAYQQEIRRIFLSCIGGVSEPLSDFQITERLKKKDFTVEKLLLQPRKGTWVSANVYVPSQAPKSGRYPAVLITVGHDDRGKADPAYQYLAQALVHAGIAALVLDPTGQGERFEHYEKALGLQPIQGCSGEHDLLDWKAKLTGVSLARYFVQDGIAAFHYLSGRADIDADRIGITGHSGGGTQACMLMLAIGHRFACGAPCAYVSSTQAMFEYGVDYDNEMIWPGSLKMGLDQADALAGLAPKPLLLLTNRNDFFPREGTEYTLSAVRALWQAAGAKTLPEMSTAQSEHAYSHFSAHRAAAFFARYLAQADFDEDSFRFEELSEADLHCTPQGQLLLYDPVMRTVQDEIKDEMLRCRAAREALSTEQMQKKLASLLHTERIFAAIEPCVYAEGICGHFNYRCVFYPSFERDRSAGVFLRGIRQGDAPLPTVLALWPEGTQRIAEHSYWIHQAAANGWQVFIPDVAASGALLPARLAGSPMYIGWSTLYHLNAYLIQLGDSLFAHRVCQLLGAVRLLKSWPEADAARIGLYAQDDFIRYALIVSLLEELPLCANGCFASYEEIVAERYHDQTNTHTWFLPDALSCIDYPMLGRLAAQRNLLMANPSALSPASAFPNA